MESQADQDLVVVKRFPRVQERVTLHRQIKYGHLKQLFYAAVMHSGFSCNFSISVFIFTHSRITKLIYFFLPSSVSMEGVTTILLLFKDGGGGGGKCDLITLGLSESKNT